MALLVFGSLAVGMMLIMYVLEDRSPWFVLAFAGASAAAALYGLLIEAWPFAVIEAVWSAVAVQRWRGRMRKRKVQAAEVADVRAT